MILYISSIRLKQQHVEDPFNWKKHHLSFDFSLILMLLMNSYISIQLDSGSKIWNKSASRRVWLWPGESMSLFKLCTKYFVLLWRFHSRKKRQMTKHFHSLLWKYTRDTMTEPTRMILLFSNSMQWNCKKVKSCFKLHAFPFEIARPHWLWYIFKFHIFVSKVRVSLANLSTSTHWRLCQQESLCHRWVSWRNTS